MNIPDKEEINRLSAAIMRRIEFDQCIHASSIEDEVGKWVREVLEPKQKNDLAEQTYKMARAVAYRAAIESAIRRSGISPMLRGDAE